MSKYEVTEVAMVFDDLEERTAKTISNLRTEMANITVPEARMLVINVWDQSALKAVEKAIIAANVGIFPTNDGKVLRMVFPELTEERRRSLVKDVKVAGENAKVAVRNIRRDAIDLLRGYKKDSVVTEDDLFALEKDVDKAVNAAISDIDKICSDKETEIMSV